MSMKDCFVHSMCNVKEMITVLLTIVNLQSAIKLILRVV